MPKSIIFNYEYHFNGDIFHPVLLGWVEVSFFHVGGLEQSASFHLLSRYFVPFLTEAQEGRNENILSSFIIKCLLLALQKT